MEKKIWSRPVAEVEQFIPNEYIAACWGIACEVATSGKIHDGFGQDTNDGHRVGPGLCGNSDSQYVQDVGDKVYQLTEMNAGYGAMQCTVYPDATFSGTGTTIFTVEEGQTIYWTTTWKNNKWYHHGTVSFTDPNRTSKHS